MTKQIERRETLVDLLFSGLSPWWVYVPVFLALTLVAWLVLFLIVWGLQGLGIQVFSLLGLQ